jgi:hypothetical protein
VNSPSPERWPLAMARSMYSCSRPARQGLLKGIAPGGAGALKASTSGESHGGRPRPSSRAR